MPSETPLAAPAAAHPATDRIDDERKVPKQLPKLSVRSLVLPSGWQSAADGSSPLGDLNANVVFPFPGSFFARTMEAPPSPSGDGKRKPVTALTAVDENVLLVLSRFV
jgi:hypothetical protein